MTTRLQYKGGSFTGSSGSKTCVLSFTNPTAGSDLILAYARVVSVTGGSSSEPPDPTFSISAPGLTFVQLGTPAKCYTTPYISGAGSWGVSWVYVYAAFNAPSSSAAITASVSIGAGTINGNVGILEFSCNPTVADITLGPVTQNNTSGTGTTYTVTGGNISPSASDFVFAVASVLGGDPLAIGGSGWVSEPAISYGQYYLSAPGGALSTTFANPSYCFSVEAFSFSTVPVIASVTSNVGNSIGGDTVTISGSLFTGATGVTFGGVSATGLVVVNDSTITVTTPSHAAGAVDVAVTIPAGTGTLASGFTYIQLSASPSTILALEKIWAFSPCCGDSNNDPQVRVLTVTTDQGSFTIVSDSGWIVLTQLSSTTYQVAVANTLNTGLPTSKFWPYKTPAEGVYTGNITVSAGGISIIVPVTFGSSPFGG